MQKIICFGDSNTFGFKPADGNRFNEDIRWTGVLSKHLGSGFQVIEEGCNNRTGFFLNTEGILQSGKEYLPQCLIKHITLDIFIFALGTNDLQAIFKIDENIIKTGLKYTIDLIRKHNSKARIIIIPPVIFSEKVLMGPYNYQFNEDSVKNSILIQKTYKDFSKKENCEYLNLNKFVLPSNLDGIHFDENSHKIIASKIAKQILEYN